VNLQQAVNFDPQSFIDQLSSSATSNNQEGWVSDVDQPFIDSTFTDYRTQLEAYVLNKNAGATVSDVIGEKSIIQSLRPTLASSLPYRVKVIGEQFNSLPDSVRHKFKLELFGTGLSRGLGAALLNYEISLPKLTGKKMTISFSPATIEDEDVLKQYSPQPISDGSPVPPDQWAKTVPGYLIKMNAKLRIDGLVVATGGTFTLGEEFVKTNSLWNPGKGWIPSSNNFVAGSYIGMEVTGSGVHSSQVRNIQNKINDAATKIEKNIGNIETEEFIGNMLYSTVLTYFGMLNTMENVMARSSGIVSYNLPSFGTFLSDLKVNYLFGLPVSVEESGGLMDIERISRIIVDTNGNKANKNNFAMTVGFLSSMLENVIPEQLYSTPGEPAIEGISAAKAIALANSTGAENLSH